MRYLNEERFIVQSNDKESLRNYRDGWERTFGEKEPEPPQETPTPEQQAVRDYLAAGGEPSPIGWYGVVTTPVEPLPCEGCDEVHCECDEHDPDCEKLCTQGSRCNCGRASRL